MALPLDYVVQISVGVAVFVATYLNKRQFMKVQKTADKIATVAGVKLDSINDGVNGRLTKLLEENNRLQVENALLKRMLDVKFSTTKGEESK